MTTRVSTQDPANVTTPKTIAFIGAGNMARSLIGGLIADGFSADSILAVDNDSEQAAKATRDFRVRSSTDNIVAIAQADVVVLAVKPQALRSACKDMAAAVQEHKPLLVSIAAGVRAGDIDRWLGGNTRLVRTMPNTPSLVQAGATALYASNTVNAQQRDAAETIMRAVGLTLWVKQETQLDAVTAVSGSGPAYFFLVMEAMQTAAEDMGLDKRSASLLTLQTAFGAAKMALESSDSTTSLRKRVTSPGGTTEQAIKTLEAGGLNALFQQALTAARDRSVELGDMLGTDLLEN